VVIRITRSFTQQAAAKIPGMGEIDGEKQASELMREPYRFVPYPGNAVELHRKQHNRLSEFERWLDHAGWDEIQGSGTQGVIAAGFCYSKLLDVLPLSIPENLRILKLSSLYPLPRNRVAEFLESCEEVLVLEESDACIETSVKALAYDLGASAKIHGKQSGYLPHGDELLRWQIQKALTDFVPSFISQHNYLEADQANERPTKKNHCASSPNEHILALLQEVANELGQKPILISDPGCWVKVAGALDGKFAIGSATAVASGMIKAGANERVVALFGDSAFFHSAIPAICNAAYNESNVLMLMLDNSGALSTGRQPTPATGTNATGQPAKRLDIANIARACGVSKVRRLPSDATDEDIKAGFRAGLEAQALTLLIIEVA
jgi:indolepyruvate ferredoxin oxidoreductase alpha subunit